MSSRISLFSSGIIPTIIFIFLFKAVQEGIGDSTGYLFASFILLLLFAWRSSLTIEEDTVTRHISLLNKDIHQRRVSSEEIREIKFRRAGWMRKRSIIVTSEGRNMHIGQAEDGVMEYLESFAKRHEIPRDYAKEYKWL
ncbi:hypothetical protein [Salimicrobium halophilum]|uniref:PH domain-containing protein n=1 Tax=Salimicrobium halophilum TaxID=86666 RepID=A0A1G8R5A6_9BACI|nr:hypothetical protein [Salimicrobium halophilum]SDJ11590.1 hypothetical protein SAMN04490247_0802 [Salimicrobium halophilum]